jgi:uncharacterized membrane protein
MNMGNLVTLVALVGSVAGGYVYIDDKKADHVDVDSLEVLVAGNLQQQQIQMIDYQLKDKRREITRINKKVQTGTASAEDLMYLEDLKEDQDWLKQEKESVKK